VLIEPFCVKNKLVPNLELINGSFGASNIVHTRYITYNANRSSVPITLQVQIVLRQYGNILFYRGNYWRVKSIEP